MPVAGGVTIVSDPAGRRSLMEQIAVLLAGDGMATRRGADRSRFHDLSNRCSSPESRGNSRPNGDALAAEPAFGLLMFQIIEFQGRSSVISDAYLPKQVGRARAINYFFIDQRQSRRSGRRSAGPSHSTSGSWATNTAEPRPAPFAWRPPACTGRQN